MSLQVVKNSRTIEEEISTFQKQISKLSKFHGYAVKKLCDFAFLVTPRSNKNPRSSSKSQRSISITLMGLTHGSEPVGAAVLNDILTLIIDKRINITLPTAFVLGNPWAAKKKIRYIDRDLNRSFLRETHTLQEEKRAKELEPILENSLYLLDFHQTTQKSEEPFFIFPYTKKGLCFARILSPQSPIITHWGDPYSKEGCCTDEFVIRGGGTGVTLELGQNGLDPYQISFGVLAGIRALLNISELFSESHRKKEKTKVSKDLTQQHLIESGPLFTFGKIMPYPAHGKAVMDAGWYNFKKLNKNERLGTSGGNVVRSPLAGYMLFPNYPDELRKSLQQSQGRKKAPKSQRPTELCYILKKISFKDLPKDPQWNKQR